LKKEKALGLFSISLILSITYKPGNAGVHIAKYGTRIALVCDEESVNE